MFQPEIRNSQASTNDSNYQLQPAQINLRQQQFFGLQNSSMQLKVVSETVYSRMVLIEKILPNLSPQARKKVGDHLRYSTTFSKQLGRYSNIKQTTYLPKFLAQLEVVCNVFEQGEQNISDQITMKQFLVKIIKQFCIVYGLQDFKIQSSIIDIEVNSSSSDPPLNHDMRSKNLNDDRPEIKSNNEEPIYSSNEERRPKESNWCCF